MWHQGLLFKLKFYVVEGNFLRLLQNYLDNQTQWKIIVSDKGIIPDFLENFQLIKQFPNFTGHIKKSS